MSPRRESVVASVGRVVAWVTIATPFVLSAWGVAARDKPDLALQTGHLGRVLQVAWSPDNRYVATRGDDNSAKVWDPSDGRLLADIRRRGISTIDWSPDSRRIAIGSTAEEGIVWDTKSGESAASLGGPGEAMDVVWSPSGTTIAVAGRRKLSFLDGRSFRALGGAEPAVSMGIRWSADGKRLSIGSELFRVSESAPYARLDDHKSGWNQPAAAWSSRGDLIAGGSSAGIQIWDAATGRLLARQPHADPVRSIAWSPDGTHLAAGSLTLLVWKVAREKDRATLTPVAERSGHRSWIQCVEWSPDGKQILTGGADASAILWRMPDVTASTTLSAHAQDITALAWSADGKRIALASVDHNGSVWSRDGKLITMLTARVRKQLAVGWSPDGKLIAAGGSNSPVRICETASGQAITVLRTEKSVDRRLENLWSQYPDLASNLVKPAETIDVSSLAWLGDRIVVGSSGGKGLVETWEPRTGRRVATWTRRGAFVSAVAVSPDMRRVAVAGPTLNDGDAAVSILGASSGTEQLQLDIQRDREGTSVISLSWSPDGRYLARSGGVWDLEARRIVEPFTRSRLATWSPDGKYVAFDDHVYDWNEQRFVVDLPTSGDVWSAAFSPDSTMLATAIGRNVGPHTIAVWTIPSGERIATLEGHPDGINDFAWSPDGRFLLSASSDGTVRLWSLADQSLLATILFVGEGRDWLVITPDGLFDGSPEAWKLVGWHADETDYLHVDAVEIFFRDFYYPGLLPALLGGRRPVATRSVANVDRRQPVVALHTAGAPGEPIRERDLAVRLSVDEAGEGSGARDVRLFRNGSLVKVWHGDVLASRGRTDTLIANVPLVAGENRLTAYAFNRDNIKSLDAELLVIGDDRLRRKGTAWVIVIGIDEYASPDYSLMYAVADARAFADEMLGQQTSLGAFARVEIVPLFDRDATRANILAALGRLGGSADELASGSEASWSRMKVAQPEDAVFVYYAGHGTAVGQRFYLIPHDLGYEGSREELDADGLKTILAHSISDLDLERAFEPIDAGRLLVVIDACNSGQALEAEEKRRGPMNSRGLAQLAYEKGMYILAAAQGYQAAKEAAELGHGFLTYALVEEGLRTSAADQTPRDGQIVVREWLDYATLRVPQLQEKLMSAAHEGGREVAMVDGEEKIRDLARRSLQRPRVFYRREPEKEPFVVAGR